MENVANFPLFDSMARNCWVATKQGNRRREKLTLMMMSWRLECAFWIHLNRVCFQTHFFQYIYFVLLAQTRGKLDGGAKRLNVINFWQLDWGTSAIANCFSKNTIDRFHSSALFSYFTQNDLPIIWALVNPRDPRNYDGSASNFVATFSRVFLVGNGKIWLGSNWPTFSGAGACQP